MQQTWRWFGPADVVGIDAMRQAGVQGVVTALHHLPAGTVWPEEEIALRQAQVARMADGTPSGLRWEVVESLPVSEAIKTRSGDWRSHLESWKTSLGHLARAGIGVVCYNFMPVLDWTRTDIAWRRPSGATCMRFDLVDFAAFDIHILQRPGAAADFSPDIADAAAARAATLDDAARAALARNITMGLPGAAGGMTLSGLRDHLARYAGIDAALLRRHLIDFLAEVAPVAQRLGLRLCCHPDDPPFALLGLPRIMSREDDYAAVLDAVDLPASGITLCTGSLGARDDNDPVGMMRRLGSRVHFLHLRNVTLEGSGVPVSFFEDEHLAGGTDMVAMVAAVLAEERRRRAAGRPDHSIPFRPDHGQDIAWDQDRRVQPGYPLIGRLKGLAELRGIITALDHPATRAAAGQGAGHATGEGASR